MYLGKEYLLPVRLLIVPVPATVKAQRLKKLKAHTTNQSKQKKAYQNSEIKKLLCGFNLFISNVSQEKLAATKIAQFYGLRWQIERLFKI